MDHFNQPQRQAKIGIIVHFLYVLQKLGRAFIPLLIVFLLKITPETRVYLLLGSLGLAVFLLIIAYLNYKNFRFYIRPESQEFIIEKGILNRSKIMIQLDKIQQVNINQSFIQKLVGVFAVEIDSAGSSAKEVVINSVSYAVAAELKQRLLSHSGSASTTAVDTAAVALESEPTTTTKISMFSLIKVGLTSHYVQTFLVILLFINTIYDKISRFMGSQFELDPEGVEAYVNQYWVGYVILFFAIVSIFAVLVFNLIRTLYKFYDFTIVKQSDTLLLSFGLLATRSTIIKPNRVQLIKIVQNYFQKKWGILQIHIRQASGSQPEQVDKKSALEIPGCSPSEKQGLFDLIYGSQPVEGLVLKSSNRFFWMRFFSFGLLPVAAFVLFFQVYFIYVEVYVLLPLYVLLVAAVVYRMYRVRSLFVHPDFIVVKKGFWDISTEIVQPYKIQKIETSQFFWQKSSDIGNLSLFTAGGVLRFNTARYSEIEKRVDYWLYQVETTDKNWM
ncbi:PH domain-containing protein [Flavobacterium sp. JP2137]|uniref:PH domain-containing protein n=1 Tax=Flavobacterium sp. JP2137 TaxID=3414510 RepID=UPI003D2FAD73